VNKEEDLAEMIGLGVDGLISNYPDKAKAILKK
jgi:glycerophosphoryl diester phosphodiesterase